MAAPRKYTDNQRSTMFDLHCQGFTPAEIARRCAAGMTAIDPFVVPRRTVHSIVSAMRFQLGEPMSDMSDDRPLELRLKDLTRQLMTALEREMDRIQRREATGRPVDSKTATDLSRCI